MYTEHDGIVSGTPLTADAARGLLLAGVGADDLHRLVRLAALALRAPVAMLGVEEPGRLRVVAHAGLPEPWAGAGALPLEATFCRHALQAGEPFIVQDAARHPLAYGVAELDNFPRAAYCGAPLLVGGTAVAVLSVSDVEPRRWTLEDALLIRDLAAGAVRDLERVARRTATTDAFFTVDADWHFTSLNERARGLLGLQGADVTSRNFWELFPSLVGTVFHRETVRAMADRRPCELEDYCESAGRWLELKAYPSEDGGAAVYLRDVSERHGDAPSAEPADRYRTLFQESRTALFVMNADGALQEANISLGRLLGRRAEDLRGKRFADIAADAAAAEQVLAELRDAGLVEDVELALTHPDGHEIMCQISASAQGGGGHYHGAIRDITAQKQTEEELVRTALRDPLTQLPNRLVFMDRLERMLKQSRRREGNTFAVLFLDLDNFKQINDAHGHLFGDQLLMSVARRLEGCIRDEDTVARIGGDEFAVLLDMVHDVASVTVVVDRIRESLAEPFIAEGRHAATSASIGIAMSLSKYDRAEDLLRDADAAMYRAKAGGRDDYMIFDAEMHERAMAQRQLEDDLRDAMDRDQLAVHYHPVVELNRGVVTGLEALIRWSHPERGVLLPAEFIPLAEQTGLIVDIGWWVLREACRQLRAWQHDYPDAAFKLTMSVNLSARQFVHPALVDKIDEILKDTGLAPECLRLDLTEAVVMKNAELAARLLRQLRDRGIQICIDDFGTGYTSLRQLREFPISTLKIDRSFIRKLGHAEGGREVVQTIIALGRSMAIDAVAEGVETPEQLAQLRSLGTKFAQGFLFSLPLDGDAATRLLQQSAG
jgi:diguanylate cyclase (GGDEF)-like protein/PAS domain S-box-containing protein